MAEQRYERTGEYRQPQMDEWFETSFDSSPMQCHSPQHPQSRWILRAVPAVPAEVRLYGNLFRSEDPGSLEDLFADIDPDSERVLTGCQLEGSLQGLPVGETVQFERLGYFCKDPDSTPDRLVFDRTVTLKDTWAKVQARG